MSPILEVTDLSIGHAGRDDWRIDGIALSVMPGEIVAVLGPSGCGKSTLLATIAGIMPALGGTITLEGADITMLPAHLRTVGMVFQEPLLFPHLDVAANVAYGLERHGLGRRPARERANDLLAWVELDGFGTRRVDELSGGQAQRVALARALAPEPAVMLLDEPFSALDVDLRTRLAGEVSALLRDRGLSAIHVTHDPAEAAAIADRIVQFADLHA